MIIDSGTRRPRVVSTTLALLTCAGLAAGLDVGAARPTGAAVSNLHLTLASNVAPVPNFLASGYSHVGAHGVVAFPNPCVVVDQAGSPVFKLNDRDVGCTNYVLRAIDRARHLEGVAPMTLPTNWYHLTTAQQLFVVADLERVDRGLAPYVGLNAALSRSAQRAALATRDPGVAPGFAMSAMGSTWASAGSVLEADFSWLYSDGWGGSAATTSNYECTSPSSATCWGHRKILLGHYTGLNCRNCELGTGFAVVGANSSYVVLVERPAGPTPPTVFSWARDVLPFLRARPVATTTSSVPVAANSPGPTNANPNATG